MGTIMNNRMINRMTELTEATPGGPETQNLSSEVLETLGQLNDPKVLMDPALLDAIHVKLPENLNDYFGQLVNMLSESLSYALTGVFFFGACIILVAFVLTLFLKELPLRTSMQKGEQNEAQDGENNNRVLT